MIGFAIAVLLCGNAAVLTAQEAAPPCKISLPQAMKAATGKVPGHALNATFEFEDGKWMCTIGMISGKTLTEVQVNPMTGVAGEAEVFTPDKEAKDMKQELKEAIAAESSKAKAKAGK